jgi:hypothetical protein
MPAIAEALGAWHDFYALIGTAAATLVGLTFVTASIGGGVFRPERGTHSFPTPTIVHFSAILVTYLIVVAPGRQSATVSFLLIFDGAAGLAYCGWIWLRMLRHGLFVAIDAADRLWYAMLPAFGYVLVASAGIALVERDADGLYVLAIGLVILLIAAIRNAWAMTIWIIERRGN